MVSCDSNVDTNILPDFTILHCPKKAGHKIVTRAWPPLDTQTHLVSPEKLKKASLILKIWLMILRYKKENT